MACKFCNSQKQNKFGSEIAVHFPELKGLEKPIVWLFSELTVCLDCGFSEFSIPEAELRVLANQNLPSV